MKQYITSIQSKIQITIRLHFKYNLVSNMFKKDEPDEFVNTYISKFAEFFLTKIGKPASRSRATSAVLRQDNSKFAVMRSVSKGIKNVNISEILNHEFENKQISRRTELNPDSTNIETLKDLRRLYDQALIEANKRQKEYIALKVDNEKLIEKEKQIQQVTNDIAKLNKKLENQHHVAHEENERLHWEKKSHEHIRLRLRHDKVVLAKRLLYLEELLKQKQFEKREMDEKFEVTKQLNDQTIRLLRQMKYNAQVFEERKRQNMNLYQNGILTQKQIESLRIEKEKQIEKIAQSAMQDKGENQKTWEKLLAVHKFVKVLLRDKMQRQLKKFAVVEKAYQQIKTKTGVWQSEQFVEKFINRDETYGNLLYSIAEAERKINASKKVNEQLRAKQHKLKDMLNELEKPSKKNEIDLTQQFKLITKSKQKNIHSEVIKERLYKFGLQALKKLDLVEEKSSTDYRQLYGRDSILQMFCKIQERVHHFSRQQLRQKINEMNLKDIIIQNPKNIRIKLNSDSQQNEQYLVKDQENDQVHFIDGGRQIIEKTNQEFMKEAKRRMQQKKLKRIADKDKVVKKQYKKEEDN